jgi:hypothetical protein
MAEDHDAGTGHLMHRDCDSVTAHLPRFQPLDTSHHKQPCTLPSDSPLSAVALLADRS